MIRSRSTLKTYFETGDTPTESQFSDLIDSFKHMDDINTAIQITRSDLMTAIDDAALNPGSFYLLNNAQSTNPNCIVSSVLMVAMTNNSFFSECVRFQLVPDYNVVEIWHSSDPNPNVDDLRIHCGKVYKNLTGANGNNTANELFLDTTNWVPVPYEAGDNYTLKPFECCYDITADLIWLQQIKSRNVKNFFPTFLYQVINYNPNDFTDWNMFCKNERFADIHTTFGVYSMKNLVSMYNVHANGIANCLVENISDVMFSTIKYKYDYSTMGIIRNIDCVNLRTISNPVNISNIPATVPEYSYQTDDESGYIEINFSETPKTAGTYIVSCILPKNVSIVEAVINCDTNLNTGVNIEFGIQTDDPTYMTALSDDINTAPQRSTTVGNRTTAFSRELILTIDDTLDQGVLWIAYKYV